MHLPNQASTSTTIAIIVSVTILKILSHNNEEKDIFVKKPSSIAPQGKILYFSMIVTNLQLYLSFVSK